MECIDRRDRHVLLFVTHQEVSIVEPSSARPSWFFQREN